MPAPPSDEFRRAVSSHDHDRIHVDLDPEPMRTPGAPLLLMLRDPDGNTVVVVDESAA
jgi:hypothetical protein